MTLGADVSLAIIARVDLLGFTRVDVVLNAIQSRRNQCSQSEIGIAAMVGWFELQVDGVGPTSPKQGWDANGTLTIVEAISSVG